MMIKQKFILRKMKAKDLPKINYYLNDSLINNFLGKNISLRFTGNKFCINCQQSAKKLFNQGYCYKCFISLAECDLCILKPELCHYRKGTCRDPKWGEGNCLQNHIVYLANTSGLKIGITRKKQIPTRWIDQGATEALPLAEVPERLVAGQFEVAMKKFVSDKTDWRALVKGLIPEIDLHIEKNKLITKIPQEFTKYLLPNSEALKIIYPIISYPQKFTSFNADKDDLLEGKLQGIRGQYLLFEDKVINIRKYQGYEVELGV